MGDRDPLDTDYGPEDYDDDGSPKFATEAERAAGWAAANHATNLDVLSALDPRNRP